MKTLIFSDSHLGKRFDPRKFDFLKKIIKEADRVIINGDFWEGFEMKFEEFINSKWKALFHLLKAKKTVYIYGNHDEKELSTPKTKLFSVKQTYLHKFKIKNKTFVIEHGQRLLPLIDELIFNKLFGINPPEKFNILFEYFEGTMIRLFPRFYIRQVYERFGTMLKTKVKKTAKKNEIYIFGHTHFADIDESNNFVNSGFIKHGLGQYLVIDEGGNIKAKEEKY